MSKPEVTPRELEAVTRVLTSIMQKHECTFDRAKEILLEELQKSPFWRDDEPAVPGPTR